MLLVSCSGKGPLSVLSHDDGTGTVTCQVSTANAQQEVIKTADLQVAGHGMQTISKRMSVSPNLISGRVDEIPVGKGRSFKVTIYDSVGAPQYEGTSTADISGGEVTAVPVTLSRVTGSVQILGEVEPTNYGYRYYKLTVNSIGIGGPNEAILTETSFLNVNTPVVGGYTTVSHSAIETGNELSSLFNGDTTASGGYIKFSTFPWSWTVDMGAAYVFTQLKIASWETFFYKEPSSITIFGSTDGTTWNEIGASTFSATYDQVFVQLTY
jgi:hypothetical protein